MGVANQYLNISPFDRFKTKYKIVESGCWEWQAGRVQAGYGVFYFHGKSKYAHRMSYEFFIGEIPDELLVCHTCDNPSCVNPFHIFLGTDKTNVADSMNKLRRPVFKHPSLVSYQRGCRCEQCFLINSEYNKAWRLKRKLAKT